MHTTWLVKNASAFGNHARPTSDRDRILPIGVTYDEWYAIYFDVLKIGQPAISRSDDDSRTIVGEFSGDVLGYPMLSRIRGYLYDATFEANEVSELREECDTLLTQTSLDTAVSGLQKLIFICDRALEENLSIYLMCD